MNLDDRARRAARALHQAATPTELEVPAAADRVRSAASARQRRVATARIAAAGVAVLAAALVGGVLSSGGSSDDGDDEVAVQRTTTTTVPVPDSTLPDARAQFEAVPASPIDGRDSYRLPVIATPRDGLSDGQTITLLGKGFEPNERVGLVQCAAEALYELQAACDLLGPAGEAEGPYGGITYADTNAAGEIDAPFVVRRHITTPNQGAVDCASAPERCFVGIGAINNYDRSGSTFVNFAGAPPFPTPTVTVANGDALTPGAPTAITVEQWLPNRSIRLEQCVDDACRTLIDGFSTADGTFTASPTIDDAVLRRDAPSSPPIPCDGACTIRAVPIDIPEATGMVRPDPVTISFVDDEVEELDETVATTAPEPASAPTTSTPDTTVTTIPAASGG